MLNERLKAKVPEMAQEFLLDFSWVLAGARCDLGEVEAEIVFRSPDFVQKLQDIKDMLEPEDVETETNVLLQLKQIAHTALKDSDRINALKQIAAIRGFEAEKDEQQDVRPVVNVFIDGNKPESASPAREGLSVRSY